MKESHPAQPRRSACWRALFARRLALSTALAALLSGAFLPLGGQELPPGKGADLVSAKCFPCHGPEVVTNSAGISRPMWVQVMEDMEALGMEVTPKEYDTIVEYLATYLGPNPPAANHDAPKVKARTKPIDAAKLYEQTCSVCHGKDGRGVKGRFPPLAGNPYLAEDRTYSALVILYGLEGEIRVQGQVFGGLMPGFPRLSDAEIAALANHTFEAWAGGQSSRPVTAETVSALRNKTLTPRGVLKRRPRIN